MPTKYEAGRVSLNTTVVSSLATTPGSGVLSMYAWIAAGVLATLANPSANFE